MLRRVWIISLVAVLLAAGCGGKSSHMAKHNATHATAPATTSTAAGTGSTDCNTLGINPTGMREGTCTHAGVTWTIVDEDHILKLKSLSAKLDTVRSTKTLASDTGSMTASGEFIVASVTITNELPAPQSFDQAGTQQAGLILDGSVFKEDDGAENTADANSCLRTHGTPIQPHASQACDVIFDVPTSAAGDLGRHGSGDLYIVNFGSDLSGGVFPQAVGQIRLYH
jgi:hypothetical protein